MRIGRKSAIVLIAVNFGILTAGLCLIDYSDLLWDKNVAGYVLTAFATLSIAFVFLIRTFQGNNAGFKVLNTLECAYFLFCIILLIDTMSDSQGICKYLRFIPAVFIFTTIEVAKRNIRKNKSKG